jgi:hypothetical protein
MSPQHLARLLAVCAVSGCMSSAPPMPALNFERSVHPALESLEPAEIESAFQVRIAATAPASAGLAWVSETHLTNYFGPGAHLSDYVRKGVLDAALASLRSAPLASVASLPTVEADPYTGPDAANGFQKLRSACAHFQYDLAIVLQTAVSEQRTLNPFALGYLGLVTRPLFPGDDIAVSATAEVCALDVKSGVMLGCAHGRESGFDRYVFPLRSDSRSEALIEQMLSAAVADASSELLPQLAQRLAPLEVSAPTPPSR